MESAELPTEERQFEVYKEILEALEGKPVVVRVLGASKDRGTVDFKLLGGVDFE